MKNTRGYTYLISNGQSYKIGITTTIVAKRIAELQTGSARKLEISGYSYNKNALAMEKLLHKRYASKRLEGEWFNLTGDDIASIHHHFETNYLDEYLAPLSAKGMAITKIKKKNKMIKLFILSFFLGLIMLTVTTVLNAAIITLITFVLVVFFGDKNINPILVTIGAIFLFMIKLKRRK